MDGEKNNNTSQSRKSHKKAQVDQTQNSIFTKTLL